MKGIFTAILLILVGNQIISAQNLPIKKDKPLPPRIDTIYIYTKDTIFIERTDPEVVKQYLEILEKTNSQLGLLSNPYGVMVAVLATLFTLLTLAAAFIIFKQSSDYQKKIEEEIKGYRQAIDTEIKSFRDTVQKINDENKESIQTHIKQQDETIKSLVEPVLHDLKNQADKAKNDNKLYSELLEKIKRLEETKKDNYFNLSQIKHGPSLFKIISAKYGSNKKAYDVTSKISELVNSGVKFYATNDIAGDPDPGIVKTLSVEYSTGGRISFRKDFTEGQIVEL